MDLQNLIILGLGIWRISSLFVQEDGPFDVFIGIRKRLGFVKIKKNTWQAPDTFGGKLFSCVWCFSLWVAVAAYVGWLIAPGLVYTIAWVLALSTVAIIVDRIATS